MRYLLNVKLLSLNWSKTAVAENFDLHFKGQPYIDAQPVDTTALAAHLAVAQAVDSLVAALNRLNGFYAWIEQTPGRIRAAVDHIRSRPLFYACVSGRFYLSDDAEWVRQQVGDREMDPVAREEFQLAGYVTGAETLFPNVKQLQAGECLIATSSDNGVHLRTERYYRFLHHEPAQFDEANLREALDQAALASIQRLIDYAAGRQIVVPLSGGYDSRLIVTLLKRLGYDNVLTFTYGVPGNKESEYSKRVADALGLRWHFVEYSEALWREAWQTPERWAYQKWASGWNSIAHVQDWLAVKILKEQGVPETDCLFVPGHTGDFISGGHIPEVAKSGVTATLNDLSDAVLKKHYGLAPHHLVSDRSSSFWADRILDRAGQPNVSDGVSLANASEKWEWQERQAKFICNSVRVYEFFVYDWWMPLWDMEFMRFWEGVPLELRKGRGWYVEYVSVIFGQNSLSAALNNASDNSYGWVLMRRFEKIVPNKVKRLIRNILRRIGVQKFQGIPVSLGWRGRYPERKYYEMLVKGYSANGVNAHHVLDSIEKYISAKFS